MSGIDSVLLVSFGGPEGPDDVIPFLENVTRGRGIPVERLREVGEHYFSFGGVSPINEQNRALIAALRDELDGRGVELPIYWGNRNWEPYIGEAVSGLRAAGLSHPLAITTSAYSSYSGCRQYRENIAAAIQSDESIDVDKAPAYFDRPGFVQPFAEGLVAALANLAASGIAVSETALLFTTHSLPVSMAQSSGPTGGAYVRQHLQAASRVVELASSELGGDAVPEWSLVYQSRSGAPHIPWLEPDINDAIRALAASTRAVVAIPIGFISDHIEVMWDLDTQARATCDELGLTMIRVATPGTHPAFVSALADLVCERLAGATYACPADCCPAPMR